MKRKILSMVIGAVIALGGMLASGANVFTDVNSSAYWGKTDIPKLTTVIDANFALLESGGTMAGMTLTGATKFTNSITGLGTAIITNVVIYGSTIGAVNPAAGAFTTVSATGAISGSGASATLTNVAIHGSSIGAVNPSTGAFTTMSASTSATVAGKGVLVDESANVQLVQTTNVTMHSGTVWTQTWSTVFAAAPTTVIITPTELHAAVPFYSDATPSNILITVEADKNFTLTCIGQK